MAVYFYHVIIGFDAIEKNATVAKCQVILYRFSLDLLSVRTGELELRK